MSHPLINNLTDLTTEQLYSKFSELNKRCSSASRLGMGDAIMQLNLIREDYQAEITRREQKVLTDTMLNNPDFKNIIDIN